MTSETAAPRGAIGLWWVAARPKTLWAAVAPVLIGAAMAYAVQPLHIVALAFTLLGALLIQIGTNFCNDYADFKKGADTDDRIGPLRLTQAGLVSPAAMLAATVIAFTLAGACSVYLIARSGWPIAVIGVASITSGALYTAGPRPLGYMGLGDLFVLIFFGPVAVGGTYFIQTGALTAPVLLAGFAPGLLSVAILVVNNLRDIDGDRQAGKRTLAVRFGPGFARAQYLTCVIGAVAITPVLVVWEGRHPAPVIASVVTLALSVTPIKTVFCTTAGSALNPILAATARMLLVYSILFSLGWCWGT